jgi:hypothetical protein
MIDANCPVFFGIGWCAKTTRIGQGMRKVVSVGQGCRANVSGPTSVKILEAENTEGHRKNAMLKIIDAEEKAHHFSRRTTLNFFGDF